MNDTVEKKKEQEKGSASSIADPIAKNVVEFIRVLRRHAEAFNEMIVYALMVFDYVLIQVGSLAFGSTGNRIQDERAAVYLMFIVAEWYRWLRAPRK